MRVEAKVPDSVDPREVTWYRRRDECDHRPDHAVWLKVQSPAVRVPSVAFSMPSLAFSTPSFGPLLPPPSDLGFPFTTRRVAPDQKRRARF